MPWNLSFCYIHWTSQFKSKMNANVELRLLLSLVWIDSGVVVPQHHLESFFMKWNITEWQVSWNSCEHVLVWTLFQHRVLYDHALMNEWRCQTVQIICSINSPLFIKRPRSVSLLRGLEMLSGFLFGRAQVTGLFTDISHPPWYYFILSYLWSYHMSLALWLVHSLSMSVFSVAILTDR